MSAASWAPAGRPGSREVARRPRAAPRLLPVASRSVRPGDATSAALAARAAAPKPSPGPLSRNACPMPPAPAARRPARRLPPPSASASSSALPAPGQEPWQPPVSWKERIRRTIGQMDGLWGEFVPMVALFFFMAFVNTVIDSLKDTLVVTSVGGGPQVIPFLTVYAVLPASLVFFALYSLATQRFSRAQTFNVVIAAFVAFFAAFAFLAYPNHEALHLASLDAWTQAVPTGLQGLIGMARNWTFTLFYVVSELWGDVVLSLLFWGLANDITSLRKARVLYPLFGIGANVAQVAAGRFLKVWGAAAAAKGTAFQSLLQVQMCTCIASALCVMLTHQYIMVRFRRRQPPQRKDVRVARLMAEGKSREQAEFLAGYESDADLGVLGRAKPRGDSDRDSDRDLESETEADSEEPGPAGGAGAGAGAGGGVGMGAGASANAGVEEARAESRAVLRRIQDGGTVSVSGRVPGFGDAGGDGGRASTSGRGAAPESSLGWGESSKESRESRESKDSNLAPGVGEGVGDGDEGGSSSGSKSGSDGSEKSDRKMTVFQALRFVAKSPQVRSLAVMSLSQGVCTTLLEFAWKTELRRMHPTPQAFSAFMGDVASATGLTTVALMAVSPALFRLVGWKGVASVSPRLLLTAGTAFFALSWFLRAFGYALSGPYESVLLSGIVVMGAALFVLNRGCKFSLFKPAEEMVYIMLDEESRTKGKAAIDVVGAQMGKSSSSVLQQALLLLSGGSMSLILPIMTFFQLGILTEWMRAVTRLGDFYNESVKNTKFAVGGDEGNGETGGAGGRGVEMGGEGGERAAAPMAA